MISDAEKVFNDEVSTKSKTARSSHNKNRTGRNRGFFKPMTAKEMEQMNGPCIEYKFDRPHTWDEFIAAPVDVQAKILDYMSSTFEANLSILCILFRQMESTIVDYLSSNHNALLLNFQHNTPSLQNWNKFALFIGAYNDEGPCVDMSWVDERKDHTLWTSFRKMPNDVIVNFYSFVYDNFGVPNVDVSKVFGVHQNVIGKHISAFEQLSKYSDCVSRMRRYTQKVKRVLFAQFAAEVSSEFIMTRFSGTTNKSTTNEPNDAKLEAIEGTLQLYNEAASAEVITTAVDEMTKLSTKMEDDSIVTNVDNKESNQSDGNGFDEFLESAEQWSDKMRTQFSSVGNSGEDTVPESLTTNSTNAVPTIFNPMDGMTSSWQFSVTLKGCVSVEEIAKRLVMVDGQNVEITISCKSID